MIETEEFWRGAFGKDYARRNVHHEAASTALMARILARADGVASVVELGAGTGTNLRAIRALIPHAELAGVEINEVAAMELEKAADRVFVDSLLSWEPPRTWDLAFTSGVLIHIHPDHLQAAYASLVCAARRYVLVAEYYNPTPVEVLYRGNAGRLWKRDFAGELMDRFNLRLVDYGFVWRRDPVFPRDDLSWFLMEKRGEQQ